MMMDTDTDRESDNQSVKQWRRGKRTELLERRIKAGGKQRARWNSSIEPALRAQLMQKAGQSIAWYWPFKGEFDGRALMRELHASGSTILLPAVVEPRSPLEFRRWGPGEPMVHGVYKIPVPKARDVRTPHVVIAPLVGFDGAGYRLGFGGGYYDRTLATLSSTILIIGVGYELSRLGTIYPQAHDIPMHIIVTEACVEDHRASG